MISENNAIGNHFPETSLHSEANPERYVRPSANLTKGDESTFLYLLGHELLQKPNLAADISRVILDIAEKTNHSLDGILAFVSQSPAFTIDQNDMVRLEKSLWLQKVFEDSNTQITKARKIKSKHQDINSLTINIDNDMIVIKSLAAIYVVEKKGGLSHLEVRFEEFFLQFNKKRYNDRKVACDLHIQHEGDKCVVTPVVNDPSTPDPLETHTIFNIGTRLLQRKNNSGSIEELSDQRNMSRDDILKVVEAYSDVFNLTNNVVDLKVDRWFQVLIMKSNVRVMEQDWLQAIPRSITAKNGIIFLDGVMATSLWKKDIHIHLFNMKFRSTVVKKAGRFLLCKLKIKLEDGLVHVFSEVASVSNASYFQARLKDEHLWNVKNLRPHDTINRFATIAVKVRSTICFSYPGMRIRIWSDPLILARRILIRIR